MEALIGALVCLPYLWLVRRFWFVTDDAFITFRYAQNLAAGHGPRFNLGPEPPVEGYSNFLWMLLCAGFERLGLEIELWPNLVSSGCGLALIVFFLHVLRRRFELPWPMATASTLIFALHAPFAVYSTSGLATMPFALLLFWSFERLFLRAGGVHAATTWSALLLLALVRTEGVLWAGAFLALALARDSRTALGSGALVRVGLGLVLGFGAYWAWRFSYYGLPLPNTFYAKAGTGTARLARGLNYVASNALSSLNLCILVPASALLLQPRRRAVGLTLLAVAWAFPLYAVLVSGDFMAMGRFLVPGWSFACLAWALMLHGWLERGATARLRTAALAVQGAVLVLGLLPAFDLHPVPHEVRARFHFRGNRAPEAFVSEYAKWRAQRANVLEWSTLGRALNRWLEPEARIVLDAMGATAYYAERFVYDRNGLVTREVAQRVPQDARLRSPGHDRFVSWEYFLKDQPDVLQARLVRAGQDQTARQRFVDELGHQWIPKLRRSGLDADYVVDFHPLPEGEALSAVHYLVLWRSIGATTTASEAWQDLARRLAAFPNTPDPERAPVEQGWPIEHGR